MAMPYIEWSDRKLRTMLVSVLLVCAFGVGVSPQAQLDVCGCKNNPATLGYFDTADPSKKPSQKSKILNLF